MHLLAALCLFFLTALPVYGVSDPLSTPNNKYGIHIVDTNDIADTAPLVNSSGGDWGYVTMVLSDSDRHRDRWQNIFNQMRRLHLVPIIRLATHVENAVWAKPNTDRLYEIVTLLNSLNWPTQNRYIILFNEPNHAKEWGNTIDPEGYGETAVVLAKALKEASEDFFILPAGLDASAASDALSMDAAVYLTRMIRAKPELLTLMDGWTSHAYPNPGFSGSPYATGRGTLTTYQWELSLLTSLGLTKNLPVFITETGWQHSEGRKQMFNLLSPDQVGTNLQIAAQNVWNDPRIAAVTPFLFNYQDVPFDHFSFKQLGNGLFYSHYAAYQMIPKTKGAPKQRELYTMMREIFPKTLVAGSTYTLSATVKNDGQGILNPEEYELSVVGEGNDMAVFVDPLPTVEPGDTGEISIHLRTPRRTGAFPVTVSLRHNREDILLEKREVDLVPPPAVEIHAALGWRKTSNASDVTVLVYDRHTLIQKFTGLTMTNGTVRASGLTNIIPGNPYRTVILVKGYLPRQTIQALGSQTTTLYPKRFLPLDVDGDGTFTLSDIVTMMRSSPMRTLSRILGP